MTLSDTNRAARLGLRSAAAAASLAPPPPPPTSRPALAALPIPGDMHDFAKVIRRWCSIEHAAGDGDRAVRYRAVMDMRELFSFVLSCGD